MILLSICPFMPKAKAHIHKLNHLRYSAYTQVHEWKLTGSVDLGNSLNRPRQFRTSVKI